MKSFSKIQTHVHSEKNKHENLSLQTLLPLYRISKLFFAQQRKIPHIFKSFFGFFVLFSSDFFLKETSTQKLQVSVNQEAFAQDLSCAGHSSLGAIGTAKIK